MRCVFCGQEKEATDEHVYARWIRKGIWATGPTTIIRSGPGSEPRRKRTTGLTWILKGTVCGGCNGGWMKDLEDRVKDHLLPAMRGEAMLLEPAAQKLVAAWAVKTALLFEVKARETGQATHAPESNLAWFLAHRDSPEPPPGSQVWMAAVDAELLTAAAHPGYHNAAVSGLGGENEMEFYLVTYSVGYLVFQVAGQDFREPDHNTRSGLPLAVMWRPDSLVTYLRAIWPARSESISWPPMRRFAYDDLTTLAQWEGSTPTRRQTVRLREFR